MEYSFHLYNKLATDGATMALEKLLRADMERKLTPRCFAQTPSDKRRNAQFQKSFDGNLEKPPVIVCIGSDLAIGDSLGPLVGSMLKYKTQGMQVFIYGTLTAPVTAKEIKYIRTFLKETHAGSQVIAIDAAVGATGDIGLIKCTDAPLYPGAGAQKKLGAIGDISIMGIVAEKSVTNYGLLNTTRLNLVYSMSEILSDAVASVLWNRNANKQACFY